MLARYLGSAWQRGIAVLVALPALAAGVGRLPAPSEHWAFVARAAIFVAVAPVLTAQISESGWWRQSWRWWGLLTLALLLAAGCTDGTVQALSLAVFVAASEEIIFRGLAVDAVLRGRVTPAGVLAASVFTSLAFATSHFASGGVSWSAYAWWSYAGAGSCLVAIRLTSGLLSATLVHLGFNLLIRSGYLGVPILPEYAVLVPVALGTPLLTAIVVPSLARQSHHLSSR